MALDLARVSWNDTKDIVNKVKTDKLDYIKIKNFCESRDKINKVKRQTTEWQKILANNISGKGLISRICKEILQLQKNKKSNLKKRGKELRYFSKDGIQKVQHH